MNSGSQTFPPLTTISSGELVAAPNGVTYIAVPQWDGAFPWLWHGFSTRQSGTTQAYLNGPDRNGPDLHQPRPIGELNLGFTTADSRENVLENRSRFVEAVSGSRTTPLITVRQIHSNCSVVADAKTVKLAGNAEGSTQSCEADGLITTQADVLIGIQTADCIPVLVADTKCRVVAAFHAGWRGTVQRIVELGVARMQTEFGAEPDEMIAAIGPGIGACCYSVGTEVRKEFAEQFGYGDELFTERGTSDGLVTRLDLIEANRRQLLDAGLGSGAIAIVGGCTAHQPQWFYSHRASHGHAGRMMAVIGIRSMSN